MYNGIFDIRNLIFQCTVCSTETISKSDIMLFLSMYLQHLDN